MSSDNVQFDTNDGAPADETAGKASGVIPEQSPAPLRIPGRVIVVSDIEPKLEDYENQAYWAEDHYNWELINRKHARVSTPVTYKKQSENQIKFNKKNNAIINQSKTTTGLNLNGNFARGGHAVVEWRAACRPELCIYDCYDICEYRIEYERGMKNKLGRMGDCAAVQRLHGDVVESLRRVAPWIQVEGADYMVVRELAANTVKLEYIRSLMNRAAGGLGGAFAAGEGTALASLRKALGQAERRQDLLFEKLGLNPTSRAKLAVNVEAVKSRTAAALDDYEAEADAIRRKYGAEKSGAGDGEAGSDAGADDSVIDGEFEDMS